MKILIVDNGPTNRLISEEMCKEYGEVHVAEYGAEGLDKYMSAVELNDPYDLMP